MNSDEAEARVRAAFANGEDDSEALSALLDFHEMNKAIIGDRDREVADLTEQLNALGNEADAALTKVKEHEHEIERLQAVVADQALTIGALKDELGKLRDPKYGLQYATPTGFKPAWQINQEVEKLREEAQTARLALDVALKALQGYRDREDSVKNLVAAALDNDHMDDECEDCAELYGSAVIVRDFEIERRCEQCDGPESEHTPESHAFVKPGTATSFRYDDLSAFKPSPEFDAAIKKAMDRFHAWRCPKCGASGRVFWPAPELDLFTVETASTYRVSIVCSKGCAPEPGAAT